ncbi:MAG: PAS domain-containing protein [Candidatus Heimdallarchaeota archaeon]|nr:PAS domain-containing protein [Candidatus Heimdallarchaeota archaeon]
MNKGLENNQMIADFKHTAELTLNYSNIRFSIISPAKELLFTTKNSERIIGYSFEDFEDYSLSCWGYVHLQDRKELERNFQQILTTSESPFLVYRTFNPHGELSWMLGGMNPFFNEEGNYAGIFHWEYNITKHKQEIDEITKLKDFFSQIISIMPQPLMFVVNNQIIWVNKPWINFFDYPMEEVINKSIDFLFSESSDLASFITSCNKLLRNQGQMTFSCSLQKKGGKNFIGKIFVKPLNTADFSQGLCLVFFDKSERVSREEKYNDIFSFSRSLFKILEFVIIRVENNKISWINDFSKNLLDYSSQELIDKPLNNLFENTKLYQIFRRELITAFNNKSNFSGEIELCKKDGTSVSFSVKASPVSYDNISNFVLILEPSRKLKSLVNTLRREKIELQFYNLVSYNDIQNLCQEAITSLELSLEKIPNNHLESANLQRNSITKINQIIQRVENLQKYFKIQQQEYSLNPFDIYFAFKKAKKKIELKFNQKKIILTHNLEPDKYMIQGNELLIDVFENILDNSIFHNNKTGIEIEIIATKITEKGIIRVEFIDNGPGIADELKPLIFSRYQRSDSITDGSGFGLTFVRQIISHFNGEIWVEDKVVNESSQGTKIIIEIPEN